MEEYGRLRVHPGGVALSTLALSKVYIEDHLTECDDCRQIVEEAQRQQVERESVKGMIRTALVTHHARHGVMLPEVDEFIERLADAIMAKLEREAAARRPHIEAS